MFRRLSKPSSPGKMPGEEDRQTPDINKMLSGRWAGIIGASFFIALCAGGLAYLAAGRSAASVPAAVLASGVAFAGALNFLNSLIA